MLEEKSKNYSAIQDNYINTQNGGCNFKQETKFNKHKYFLVATLEDH